jgi:hypothetical protein
MTNDHSRAMVLRDSDGNYYVLPIDVMERARVPAERVAEVEAAIGEVTAYAMGSAVGGGIVDLDGSFLVDEEVEGWPVVETPRGGGIISAMRMIAGSRF